MKDKAKSETTLMHKIMIAVSNAGARVFRNHAGTGYYGEPVRVRAQKQITMFPGDVLIRQARPFKSGLIDGAADLVGWRSVQVTAEMVGSQVALFLACEVKSETGKLRPEQENFLGAVRHAGGIAIEGRSVEQVTTELNKGGSHETGIHRSA